VAGWSIARTAADGSVTGFLVFHAGDMLDTARDNSVGGDPIAEYDYIGGRTLRRMFTPSRKGIPGRKFLRIMALSGETAGGVS